jgi:hypothetical protein
MWMGFPRSSSWGELKGKQRTLNGCLRRVAEDQLYRQSQHPLVTARRQDLVDSLTQTSRQKAAPFFPTVFTVFTVVATRDLTKTCGWRAVSRHKTNTIRWPRARVEKLGCPFVQPVP